MSKKLSTAQQKVVDILRKNPEAFVLATRFWDFQQIRLNNNDLKYFKKRTREVLVERGVITEFEPNKFRLTKP